MRDALSLVLTILVRPVTTLRALVSRLDEPETQRWFEALVSAIFLAGIIATVAMALALYLAS